MQNLHDDNYLDDLSRKAAEQFQPDQELHSWQKLRPRLEAVLPRKKERKRRFLVIFLLFLLIGGGITVSAILMNRQSKTTQRLDKTPGQTLPNTNKAETNNPGSQSTGNNNTQAATKADKQVTTPPTSTSPATGTAGDQETVKTDVTATDNAETPDKKQLQNPKQTTSSGDAPPRVVRSAPDNTTKRNTPASNTTSGKKDAQVPIAAIDKSARPQNTNDKTLPDGSVTKTTPDGPVTKTAGQEKAGKPLTDSKPTPQPLEKAEKPADDPAKVTDNATDKPATEKPVKDQQQPAAGNLSKSDPGAKKNNAKAPRNRWEFGLTYAPDISTVKFTHTRPPGHNIGVTVGYNLSRRFSLQTGIIYTTKNYKSYGKDYHPPKGYWTDYVKLETVTAECNMWDIPLNLRYNIAPRKKSNFFVSTGLSSYLMLREDYNFHYYYINSPVPHYRSMDTSRTQLRTALNFSIGYERQLGRSFSLQVEPFFKQPLSGMGIGNVKLNTTGIYFTLKYKPLSGRLSP